MLKLVKWAYDLGVRQERVRIAAHLRNRQAQAAVSASSYRGMFDDAPKKMSKERLQRLKFAEAVQEEVKSILEEMLNPNWEQTMTASIMFPDDDHKGEIK